MGVSPVIISHAVLKAFEIPLYIFNSGLPLLPSVSSLDLGGKAANCLTTGKALPLNTVRHLYQQGIKWGRKLADSTSSRLLILGECVVGGTTTALSLLTGLGINAQGKVNSSHPSCNHQQKWSVVEEGLTKAGLFGKLGQIDPWELVAAVGDPMQIVVAAMAISASPKMGVMLAGGTQMLAVYALIQKLNYQSRKKANLDNIVVGTTRWVAEDLSGDTVSLAENIGEVPLLATSLNFAHSVYPSLQVYEKGFVKEGCGAGGMAIASHLQGWNGRQLLTAVEKLYQKLTEK
jgi:uncharacterized protein (TIGR00303 family)